MYEEKKIKEIEAKKKQLEFLKKGQKVETPKVNKW